MNKKIHLEKGKSPSEAVTSLKAQLLALHVERMRPARTQPVFYAPLAVPVMVDKIHRCKRCGIVVAKGVFCKSCRSGPIA